MPYMAYYGAASNNKTMVIDAADQILLYRNVLLANTTQSWNGLWVHIVGPQSQTKGIWATGNGWAALGMARVLATIKAWPNTTASPDHINRLQTAMMAIFNGLTGVDVSVLQHKREGFQLTLSM
jgi:rhamnogalacturonyl hydrolase YesR